MATATIYSVDQAKTRLAAELPAWTVGEGVIQRVFKTSGWAQTLLLVNGIGFICESACHHPDLLVSYAQVTVKLSTHEPHGITGKDFELAKLIEERVSWVPGPGAALEGFEKGYQKPWVK
jgi:pterin-4a-carbinolamine dehydratase